MVSGNSWEKRAYVHFDIGHEEAKAHLDTGCAFVIESATLRVHVSANSRDFDGAFTSSCEKKYLDVWYPLLLCVHRPHYLENQDTAKSLERGSTDRQNCPAA